MAKSSSGHSEAEGSVNSKDESQEDRNADRRDARSREKVIDRLLKELGVAPEMATAIKKDLSSLFPPQHRMSRAENVVERLTALIERDSKAPPRLLLSPTGAALDVESESTVRAHERLAKAFESDEDVLRAYVANERIRGVIAGELATHDAAGRVLIAELGRRYTLAEQWRYKLPKYYLPVVAVLLAADVKRDELRPGGALLSGIIKAVAEWKQPEGNARKELEIELAAAAKSTAEQCDLQLSEMDDQGDAGATGGPAVEPFDDAKRRLERKVNELRIATIRAEPVPAELDEDFRAHNLASTGGGGLNLDGQVVFETPREFLEAVRYIRDKGYMDMLLATKE